MTPSNNFDALRLAAAWLVLFSHQHALMGRPEPGVGLHSLGGLGVTVFFSISGYLVAQSWDRDPSAWRFLARRALRIWPGLIAVTAVSVFMLGPAFTTLPLRTYFADAETWQFFRTLKMTVRYALPGVFGGLPHPEVVNGSLWTLPIEVRWYLVLALLGALGALRHRWLVAAGTAAFIAFVLVGHDLLRNPDRSFNFEFGMYFCLGVCLHRFRPVWGTRRVGLAVGVGLAALLMAATGQTYPAMLVAIPAAAVLAGEASTPVLRRAGRFGDLSYGVYIWAFPVQQSLLAMGATAWPLWAATAAATVITLTLAWLSWHLVESPALRLKNRLRRPAAAALPPDGGALPA